MKRGREGLRVVGLRCKLEHSYLYSFGEITVGSVFEIVLEVQKK